MDRKRKTSKAAERKPRKKPEHPGAAKKPGALKPARVTATPAKLSSRKKPARDWTTPAPAATQPLYLVGIGASAGGIEALESLLGQLQPGHSMAYLLVLHMHPTQSSFLPELLQKRTSLQVEESRDGTVIEADRVYVIPPDRTMQVSQGRLRLVAREANDLHTPINALFESIAEDCGEHCIGVILSGTGSDGSKGVKAIKEKLGLVIAQDLQSARYDGMPRAVIDQGLADYVLAPHEIPSQLEKYVKHAGRRLSVAREEQEQEERFPHDAMQKIFYLLRSKTGHDFSGYKHNTIHRRIQRRMDLHQIESLPRYLRFIQQNEDEVLQLFRELLIQVTSFFRDPDSFVVLKDKIIPLLLKDKPDDYSIRIWVPGVATGEEAYSMAMVFHEYLAEHQRSMRLQIFATDIDEHAIEKARLGMYPQSIEADVSSERLRRFFDKEDAHYRIKRDVRQSLVFAQQNLIKDSPFTRLDLICCRNLLIYLNSELQRRLLPLFHYSLREGGVLFLGPSESIGELMEMFSVVDSKWKVFRRKEVPGIHPQLEFPSSHIFKAERSMHREPDDAALERIIQHDLLREYAPTCVILNRNGDIVFIHGRTGKYLEPAPGRAQLKLQEMAREGLKMRLQAALRRAMQKSEEVLLDAIPVKTNGDMQLVNVRVRPLRAPGPDRELLMVTFEDVVQPHEAAPQAQGDSPADRRYTDLEMELNQTKENLQTTIEELETSNEELKSINEEYQSTNEELKSSNEELETSREELQSLNEELATVNAELQDKIEKLSQTHKDMESLLESLEIPAIFLDESLRIQRFTPQSRGLINLIEKDVGRPIHHLVYNLKDERFIEDLLQVSKTGEMIEREVATHDGHSYLKRILSFQLPGAARGVVLSLINVDQVKRASSELDLALEAQRYAESVIETVPLPLVMLDEELRVISANPFFTDMFRIERHEIKGVPFFQLGGAQSEDADLRDKLQQLLDDGHEIEEYKIEKSFPVVGTLKLNIRIRRLQLGGITYRRILIAVSKAG